MHQSRLSPRVRGSRRLAHRGGDRSGSIPACAGEPRATPRITPGPGVYPRVCGGAEISGHAIDSASGLSPRVRGSRVPSHRHWRGRGSIPACAGEPAPHLRNVHIGWVYPRVCGGASCAARRRRSTMGLSPRVRGSRHPAEIRRRGPGFIPACAGEPWSETGFSGASVVYPRVCGGAPACSPNRLTRTGLSPRVRGSHLQGVAFMGRIRSIPACAGEPLRARLRSWRDRVYPRVCGGAVEPMTVTSFAKGLSPRVRGSPWLWAASGQAPGSGLPIPACAGEPMVSVSVSIVTGVYPRVCGGACSKSSASWAVRGLSPRVRGSLGPIGGDPLTYGSIPACAGEPY